MKFKIKTVQQIKSGIWGMKGGKYTKTLAKIQVKKIFRIRDILRNVLPKFIYSRAPRTALRRSPIAKEMR